MKFISSNIKSYLILLILVSSTLISIHTETSYRKASFKSYSRKVTKRNSNTSSSSSKLKRLTLRLKNKFKDDHLAIKIYDFLMGMLSTLPYFDEHIESVEEVLEKNDKCSKEEILKAFNDGVEKRKEDRFQKAADGDKDISQLKSSLPWRASKRTESKLKKIESKNPKAYCELIVEEYDRQLKGNTDFRMNFRGARKAASRIVKKQISIGKFKEKLPGILGFVTASTEETENQELKKYLTEHYFNVTFEEIEKKVAKKEIDWLKTIQDVYEVLLENHIQSERNLDQLEAFDKDKIDCSILPDDQTYEKNKTRFMDRLAGGWSSLKYMGKCVLESLPNHVMEALKEKVNEFLVSLTEDFLKRIVEVFASMVTKIISLFYEKAISLVWWAMKVIYYVYKAINPGEEESSLNYWGKAVGGGIRLIYIAFSPVKRKMIRRRKF